jgi:hypothetical protein
LQYLPQKREFFEMPLSKIAAIDGGAADIVRRVNEWLSACAGLSTGVLAATPFGPDGDMALVPRAEHDAHFFFAHPYASWERGANENMNGLIRQFFPKKMRFDSITERDIAFTMHRLNHRPRKCLGFKTPHEVFVKQLHSRRNVVAPQT